MARNPEQLSPVAKVNLAEKERQDKLVAKAETIRIKTEEKLLKAEEKARKAAEKAEQERVIARRARDTQETEVSNYQGNVYSSEASKNAAENELRMHELDLADALRVSDQPRVDAAKLNIDTVKTKLKGIESQLASRKDILKKSEEKLRETETLLNQKTRLANEAMDSLKSLELEKMGKAWDEYDSALENELYEEMVFKNDFEAFLEAKTNMKASDPDREAAMKRYAVDHLGVLPTDTPAAVEQAFYKAFESEKQQADIFLQDLGEEGRKLLLEEFRANAAKAAKENPNATIETIIEKIDGGLNLNKVEVVAPPKKDEEKTDHAKVSPEFASIKDETRAVKTSPKSEAPGTAGQKAAHPHGYEKPTLPPHVAEPAKEVYFEDSALDIDELMDSELKRYDKEISEVLRGIAATDIKPADMAMFHLYENKDKNVKKVVKELLAKGKIELAADRKTPKNPELMIRMVRNGLRQRGIEYDEETGKKTLRTHIQNAVFLGRPPKASDSGFGKMITGIRKRVFGSKFGTVSPITKETIFRAAKKAEGFEAKKADILTATKDLDKNLLFKRLVMARAADEKYSGNDLRKAARYADLTSGRAIPSVEKKIIAK